MVSVINGSLLTGTAALPCHLITTISPKQHTLWTEHKIIMGERHLEAVSQVIMTGHTGHHDLSVVQPNLTCLAPQTCGIHLVGRQNSQLIRSPMVMTPLHTSSIPPWGMLQFSIRRMGTNSTSPVIPNQSFIPIPASLYNLIHPAPEHNSLIKPTVTPENQSSHAKPQHAVTTNDPYNNSTTWDQHNYK